MMATIEQWREVYVDRGWLSGGLDRGAMSEEVMASHYRYWPPCEAGSVEPPEWEYLPWDEEPEWVEDMMEVTDAD